MYQNAPGETGRIDMKYSANSLTASRRTILTYNLLRDDILEKSRKLLDTFNANNIKSDFLEYKREIFNRSQQVIVRFKEQQLYHFDIFRKAGFVANENNLSDAIASILDPHESHQLGKKPILQLLDQLAKYNPDKINRIKKYIEDDKTSFVVKREKKELRSRPDIEILSSKFIIFIENKIEGGKETNIGDILQTVRHWRGLLDKSMNKGISEENVLAIYLTPKGERAEDTHFMPLSVPELISAFREAINSTDTNAKQSLLTFLGYYQWS